MEYFKVYKKIIVNSHELFTRMVDHFLCIMAFPPIEYCQNCGGSTVSNLGQELAFLLWRRQ